MSGGKSVEGDCSVAVDVGNTAVKLAVRKAGNIVDHSIVIGRSQWQQDSIAWVRQRLGCNDTSWRIASVHRSAAESLVDAVRQHDPAASIQLITYRDVSMPVDVDSPERLGIDRLVGAYQAQRQWGSPIIIVDAGSAITVDWVDGRGHYGGGAILPGLALQTHALATGTDALPEVDWSVRRQLRLPAKNTADAIYGGILIGVAASIDRLARKYVMDFGNKNVPLVMTGGDSETISPHLTLPHVTTENLVCRGLLNLTQSCERED